MRHQGFLNIRADGMEVLTNPKAKNTNGRNVNQQRLAISEYHFKIPLHPTSICYSH